MGFLTGFFLKNGFHSRRTIWMAILSLLPVGLSIILWMLKPILADEGIAVSALYPQMSFFLYLHFLLPLMSVFIGTAIIADEVEERTLPYLLVRPVPRRDIVLAKTLAGILTVGIILFISLILTYIVMNLAGGFDNVFKEFSRLLKTAGVLLLGLVVYVPFFGLLGGVMKRPVLAGLLFTFGWENTVGMFPGNIKLFTVVHYLHVLFPQMSTVRPRNARSAILDFVLPAKQISGPLATIILVALCALFVALSISLLYRKEYRLEQS